MGLAKSKSDRRRLLGSCRLGTVLALVVVLASVFFLGQAPAGIPPNSPSTAGEVAKAPLRMDAAAGTEAPGLADVIRTIKPVDTTGTPPSTPAVEVRTR